MKINEQEKFWNGNFGNRYINRNKSKKIIRNNFFFLKKYFLIVLILKV
jgi:hypothetical protein